MKKWKKLLEENTLYCTAFGIFFLCIILPVIILGGIWGNRGLQEEVARYQLQKQTQSQQISAGIEQQFEEINRTATNILLSRWLSRLNNHIGLYSHEFDVYERMGIIQDLETQAAAFYFISDIIVVVPNHDLVISTDGWFQEKNYLDYSDIQLIPEVQETKSGKSLLIPFSSLSTGAPNCTIYMEVNFVKMMEFVTNLSLGEFSVIQIQQGDHFLSQWGEVQPNQDVSDFILGPYSQGLTFSLIYPTFPQMWQWNPIILFLAVTGLMFCSAVIAAVLALVTTKPMAQILKKLPQNRDGSQKRSYWRLPDDIDDLIHRNEYLLNQLNQQMEQYEKYEKNEAMFQLLTSPAREISEYIYAWIPWYYQQMPFQVVLFQQKQTLVKKTLDVVTAVLSASAAKVITFSIPSTDGAYLVWFPKETQWDYSKLIPREYFNEYAVAVSDIETDCWQIRSRYFQAKKRLDVQINFQQKQTTDGWISPSLEVDLIYAIQNNKPQEFEKILDKHKLCANRDAAGNLIVLLLRLANEYDFPAQSYLKQLDDAQLLDQPGELQIMVCQLCQNLCQFIQESKQRNQSETARLIQEYVRDNFDNPEMSLKLLAEVFHSNISLLSKLFKNQLQINFSEYLLQIRIEYAKKMLAGTDIPIVQIASKAGYDSYLSFKRAFLRMEEMSPKEYRERMHLSS